MTDDPAAVPWEPPGDDEPGDPTGWFPTRTEADAEMSVLGALMMPIQATDVDGRPAAMNNPALAEVRRLLQPKHLFLPKHQAIMQAICDLDDRSVSGIDVIKVADELERRGELAKVGAAPYLLTLTERVSVAANATYYADLVIEAYRRRAALEFARAVGQAAASRLDIGSLDSRIDQAHQTYLQETLGLGTQELVSAADSSWLITDILDHWGEPDPGSMTTGLADVDDVLDVATGGLVVVAARSGVGKSTWAAQIARHYVFDRGECSLFFSMEMTRRELYIRDLAALAGVRHDSATGKTPATDYEREKLRKAAARYETEGALMYYDDTKAVNLAHIRSRCSQVRRESGVGQLGVVVVDYIGLMQLPRADREDQAFGEVSRSLKVMAGEFGCIVILVAQLNRGPEERSGGVPKASDIRSSDKLQQDADVIMLLHDVAQYGDRTGGDNPRAGEVDLILDKQRKGRSHAVITLADRRHFAQFGSFYGDGQ
ncbi:replicative DNA helicase [Amycolatopsis thermophila]|nr:DnaB-like helicase C-terminal domain-containing protein [Amycolatopsis thermophila]